MKIEVIRKPIVNEFERCTCENLAYINILFKKRKKVVASMRLCDMCATQIKDGLMVLGIIK